MITPIANERVLVPLPRVSRKLVRYPYAVKLPKTPGRESDKRFVLTSLVCIGARKHIERLGSSMLRASMKFPRAGLRKVMGSGRLRFSGPGGMVEIS